MSDVGEYTLIYVHKTIVELERQITFGESMMRILPDPLSPFYKAVNNELEILKEKLRILSNKSISVFKEDIEDIYVPGRGE